MPRGARRCVRSPPPASSSADLRRCGSCHTWSPAATSTSRWPSRRWRSRIMCCSQNNRRSCAISSRTCRSPNWTRPGGWRTISRNGPSSRLRRWQRELKPYQAIRQRLDPGGHRLLLETIVDITSVAPETQALLDCLPTDPHLAAAIWRTAQGWRGPYDRMRAGTFLYPHLPPAEREEVASATHKLDNDWWKYLGLDSIAEHMPDEREALPWRDRQLDVIHAMRDPHQKRNTLVTFARVCPEERWRDLIDVARRIADPVDRANALGGLVETAPDWALDEITDTVARLRSPEARD